MTELCDISFNNLPKKEKKANALVDVDSRASEFAVLVELVQVVNTSGGLFGNTADVLEHLRVLLVNESGKISSVLSNHQQV